MTFRFNASITGWKRKAIAFAFGVCATFTLAPFYFFPLIIPAYAGLFLLVEAASTRKQAFKDGFWWGWGFYISGLYWFCVALLTDAEKFAWALPLALFGITAVIALYPAVACYIYRFVIPAKAGIQIKVVRVFLFSFIWLVIEVLRGHLFSGFPWNLAGYSFGFSETSLQLASLFGAYGLTFFTVLLGASIVAGKRFFPATLWAVLTLLLLWGYQRVDGAPKGEETGAVLRLVQANVSEPHNWNPLLQRKSLEAYISLTQSEGLEKVTDIIWPESAVPYALSEDSTLARHLGEAIPEGKTLITGTVRMRKEGDDFEIFNSLVALNHEGDIIGSYDKNRLVPFGEFLPFRSLIPQGLELPVGNKDFSQGTGNVAKEGWGKLPAFTPLICYEAIFPDSIGDGSKHVELLLNVTNDVWFGNSTGPHQHFEMARMRAVEQGVPLVRAANTGISAYIDEYGRIQASLPLATAGVLDIALRKSTLDGTVYSRGFQFFNDL